MGTFESNPQKNLSSKAQELSKKALKALKVLTAQPELSMPFADEAQEDQGHRSTDPKGFLVTLVYLELETDALSLFSSLFGVHFQSLLKT